MNDNARRLPPLAALVVVFGVCTLGLQLWPGAAEGLQFSRLRYVQGSYWQLLTAQWVHLSLAHALGNALAFAVLVVFSGRWLGWRPQLLALCGGYAGVAVVLALDAQCSYYAGASGALHGLLAGNALRLVWGGRLQGLQTDAAVGLKPGTTRRVGLALLGAVALKLWWQSGGTPAAAPWGGWSFPVYHPAHIAGALGGMGLVLLALTARAVRATPEQAQRGQ
ncbi:MAG: rhomboid family intramembrane serine protease [Rhodoferax sp.]